MIKSRTMFKPFPLYVGLRYLRNRRRNHFASFITIVSTLGIALGSTVLITVLWPYSRELSEAMQAVVRYALPGALIFFGLWLGGLLGTMRVNPVYEAYREAWSTASGLVFVDCPTLHQRLLRRELAQIGLRYLDTRHRYLGSYRYPQNTLAGRRAL